MKQKIWLTFLSIAIIMVAILSWSPHAYYPMKFYNRNGLVNLVPKIWIDTIAVSSANGFTVDISSASFSSIKGYNVIALKNTATSTSVPNVGVKSISTTQLILNFTEGNASLVNVLGSNVLLGPSNAFANTSGLQVAIMVIGI